MGNDERAPDPRQLLIQSAITQINRQMWDAEYAPRTVYVRKPKKLRRARWPGVLLWLVVTLLLVFVLAEYLILLPEVLK